MAMVLIYEHGTALLSPFGFSTASRSFTLLARCVHLLARTLTVTRPLFLFRKDTLKVKVANATCSNEILLPPFLSNKGNNFSIVGFVCHSRAALAPHRAASRYLRSSFRRHFLFPAPSWLQAYTATCVLSRFIQFFTRAVCMHNTAGRSSTMFGHAIIITHIMQK